MKRSEAQSKYKWNFENLYNSIEEWKKDSKKVLDIAKNIAKLKGKLKNKDCFVELVKLEEQLDEVDSKLSRYLHLYDLDKTSEKLQEIDSIYSNISQQADVLTSFVVPETLELDLNYIIDILKNNKLDNYIKCYIDLFDCKKHILKSEEEELISKLEQSRSNYIDLYESLTYADSVEEKIMYENKEITLDTTAFKNIMQNSDPIKDQEFRKKVWDKYFLRYSKNKHTYAKIYESILLKDKEDFNLRNYKSSISMYLNSDKVSEKIYEKLISTGKKHINAFEDYFLFIKEVLSLNEIYTTDRELKLVNVETKKYSVEEGISIVKEALKELGNEYEHNLEIAFKDHMIDYYEDVNKVSGAYSSSNYNLDPIILMNWDDQFSSLNTLAHEIGHSVHSLFANDVQQYPLNEYPIILAEVASTFNEHILFDYLLNKTNEKNEKILLIQQRIFDLISTFYRQIQFAEFEHIAHQTVAKGEVLNASKLEEIFKSVENNFGYNIFSDKDRKTYNWPYISHFFYSPYYVYKYAIDIVASFKLYEDFKNNKKENIINFLKLGGSKDPLVALKQVGVDFEDENVYLPLINEIKNLLKQLKTIMKRG
ncbi:oligoendopeptidase F [Spiroplasma litorale]|uniref:Oligopeptidase F n=1 Tax=Spiroplasma litorale TaxID=216942 RepID=A0A0K1W362_9MOLU|nr:oligoendopeptidase F [Spiroplasma litorale]AKX34618.1 oligoendopeptidase F [Spiroplasma litorale]